MRPCSRKTSPDTLSDVLRAVGLRGAIVYRIDGHAPFVVDVPPSKEIIPGVMPGVEHMIEFHGVVHGSCWGGLAGSPAVRLGAGDVIFFPQGDAHVISSAPGMRAPHVDRGVYFAPRPPQLPYALSVKGSETTASHVDGGDDDRSTIVCGFLGLDARPFNPLLPALPRVLHVPASAAGADSWIAPFLRAADVESNRRRPGGEAVLERMSVMLFVEAILHHAGTMPAGQTGWLAGLRDPIVGKALSLLHEMPDEPWTEERLANEAAASRSELRERFVRCAGLPPMRYLARWREQLMAGAAKGSGSASARGAARSAGRGFSGCRG